jgi:hypothetical protein
VKSIIKEINVTTASRHIEMISNVMSTIAHALNRAMNRNLKKNEIMGFLTTQNVVKKNQFGGVRSSLRDSLHPP